MVQFTHPLTRLGTATALLAAIALASPSLAASDSAASHEIVLAQAGSTSSPPTTTAKPAPSKPTKAKLTRAERLEARIKKLHDALKITDAQAEQWNNVAQVMRDNDQKMEALVSERRKNIATMNAVDDLKSYSAIAEAHAEDTKNFNAAFTALYASMSVDQKKAADDFFRRQGRAPRGTAKSAKPASKAAPKAN